MKKGYLRASCRRKPILSAKNVKDRLLWASKYAGMDWTRVIFAGEAAFEVGDDLKKEHCWRKTNEEWDEKNLSLRKKKGKMLHDWGAIIHGHKSPLVRFTLRPVHPVKKVKIAAETINAQVYLKQVLSSTLKDAVVWEKEDGREPLC
jgi:hypothetical protein